MRPDEEPAPDPDMSKAQPERAADEAEAPAPAEQQPEPASAHAGGTSSEEAIEADALELRTPASGAAEEVQPPANVAFEEEMFGAAEPSAVASEPADEQPTGALDYEDADYTEEPAYPEDAQDNLFSTPEREPEIPLPGEVFDRRRGRHAQVNLDLDLARIKRRKRFGLFLTAVSVLVVAFFVVPVTWALAYLFIDAPSTITMMERVAQGESIRHTPVPITRISPNIVRAVIAAEDQNFCSHHGFDVEAIQKAMASNADGGQRRGASTISQQTAKNLFLWQEGGWVRKGVEAYFTSLIELMWPKRRIMEQYLNAAEWGDGIFGIEAAAQARFGVSAADLTPLQAARLAAVLPSPNRWSATSPGPYVRGRAAMLVGRAQAVRAQHLAGCVLSLDAAQ